MSYCCKYVQLFYNNVREDQWTLERIDNSIGHFKDNVVISCLECNLKRRCIDTDRFKYSKSFNNIKKLNNLLFFVICFLAIRTSRLNNMFFTIMGIPEAQFTKSLLFILFVSLLTTFICLNLTSHLYYVQ